MATSDPQDSVAVAMMLVQSLRQSLCLLERSHQSATLLVKNEPHLMRGLTNNEKVVIFGSKWSLGTFKEDKERLKTKLAMAERLVEQLQEKAVQVPVDPSDAKPACCICLLRPRNTVLIPCGHLDVCDTCAGILQATRIEGKPEGYYLCPICRTQVLFRQIVFGL